MLGQKGKPETFSQVIHAWMAGVLARNVFRSPEHWAREAQVAATTITRFMRNPADVSAPKIVTLYKLAEAAGEELPISVAHPSAPKPKSGRAIVTAPPLQVVPSTPPEDDRHRFEPIATGTKRLSPLPIMGTAVGGNTDTIALNNGEPHGTTGRPANLDGVEGAFAVYAAGVSMEPRYQAGELLHINPHKPVRKGHFVLVAFQDGNGSIKRFVSWNDKQVVVEQLNPPRRLTYPAATVRKVMKIVGTDTD